MRTVKDTRTALERKVWESVIIERHSAKQKVCLNLMGIVQENISVQQGNNNC